MNKNHILMFQNLWKLKFANTSQNFLEQMIKNQNLGVTWYHGYLQFHYLIYWHQSILLTLMENMWVREICQYRFWLWLVTIKSLVSRICGCSNFKNCDISWPSRHIWMNDNTNSSMRHHTMKYRIIYGLPLITMLMVTSGVICHNFHEWRSHEWKLLANHLTSDHKHRYERQPIYHFISYMIFGC